MIPSKHGAASAQPGAGKQQRYLPHSPFHCELKKRVEAYFTERGISQQDAPGMRLKTAIILGWLAASWTLVTFFATEPWQVVLLCVSLGLCGAAIGFNIQHDGNHGGYSKNKALNAWTAFTLDVVGGSSYVWSWKHNVFHHSNPNIEGLDSDIDIQPWCRLSPAQRRYPVHRFQAIYIFFLYSLLAFKWHFVDDFANVITGRIGANTFPKPKGKKLFLVLFGKALFLTWAFVIPMLFHPVLNVLAGYAIAAVTVSLMLAIVFQLAHVLDGAAFPDAEARGQTDWAVHQIETSMDFAPKNKFANWFLGGLNFQVVHHLFPKVCHVHLVDLQPIVEQTCREYGVNYRVHPTMRSALAAHVRWIHKLGQPEAA